MATGLPDEDIMEGIKAYWDSGTVLPSLVPKTLQSGRLDKPAGDFPWVRLECKQGLEKNSGPSPQVSGATYHDYRLVTFTAWGKKAAIVAVLEAIMTRFDEQPKGVTPLTIPNSSRVIRMKPMMDMDKFEQANEKRLGDDVWMGTKNYQLWTQRTIA